MQKNCCRCPNLHGGGGTVGQFWPSGCLFKSILLFSIFLQPSWRNSKKASFKVFWVELVAGGASEWPPRPKNSIFGPRKLHFGQRTKMKKWPKIHLFKNFHENWFHFCGKQYFAWICLNLPGFAWLFVHFQKLIRRPPGPLCPSSPGCHNLIRKFQIWRGLVAF